MTDTIYSVHQVTQALRNLLDEAVPPLWVEGEVSNFRESQAGHWYFTLKDDRAQLPCVMWRNLAVRHRHLGPADGALLRVYGALTIYPQGGMYQIQATRLLPVGQGALQLQFEQLRDRLREEGLFDEGRKRPLMRFPRRVGVITSSRGAAIRDILQVIGRRYPCVRVTIYPVVVQGEEAPPQIVRALDIMNRLARFDVLIVGRGGGSIEDLWAFNDERVVRAVAASKTPVVSAVGHEIDFTLTDFAADVRAPTPSAAAEIVVPDREALTREFGGFAARMQEAIQTRLRFARREVARLRQALSPRRQQDHLRQRSQYVDDLARRISQALRHVHDRKRERLASLAAALNALSPLSTLERGYSICFDAHGEVVTDAARVASGDEIRVRLRHGELDGLVTETRPHARPEE